MGKASYGDGPEKRQLRVYAVAAPSSVEIWNLRFCRCSRQSCSFNITERVSMFQGTFEERKEKRREARLADPDGDDGAGGRGRDYGRDRGGRGDEGPPRRRRSRSRSRDRRDRRRSRSRSRDRHRRDRYTNPGLFFWPAANDFQTLPPTDKERRGTSCKSTNYVDMLNMDTLSCVRMTPTAIQNS